MPSKLQQCINNEGEWINDKFFLLFQIKIDNQFYYFIQNFVKFF